LIRQKRAYLGRFHSKNLEAEEKLRGSPASEFLRGTAGQERFFVFVSNPPRGRPFGGGGTHRIGGRSTDKKVKYSKEG